MNILDTIRRFFKILGSRKARHKLYQTKKDLAVSRSHKQEHYISPRALIDYPPNKVSVKIRLLIIDDLPEEQKDIRKLFLFEANVEVIGQVRTSQEAIKMAQEDVPDVILIEASMPNLDGFETSRRISKVVPYSQIIIMSEQSGTAYLRRAMLAGAREYLTKPVWGDELVASIRRVFRNSQSETEVIQPPTPISQEVLYTAPINKSIENQFLENVSAVIRVLIVDDFPETQENVRKLLQFESDVEVIGKVGTGEEAIKMAQEYIPDIIMMDINMPNIDGITASREISKLVPHSQIIIMSVQSDADYLRRAMLAGARDYLTKPFGGDELVASIRRVCKKDILSPLQIEQARIMVARVEEKLSLYKNNILNGYLVDELARLVSGIAHDLRSPINIILSILDNIDASENESINEQLKRIKRRIKYCEWIADNFLGISFNEKVNLQPINLFDIIIESLELLESKLGPALHINVDLQRDIYGYTDPRLFRLALINMINNALEALPDGGNFSISQEHKEPSELQLVIKNSGKYISDKEKLFELGYTTKPAHSGLGLFVGRRMMRQQLGDVVYLEDKQSNDTTFAIYMPINRSERVISEKALVEMKQTFKHLNKQLEEWRAIELNHKQKEITSQQFNKITHSFAQNFYNELAIIETMVKKLLENCPDDQLGHSLVKIIKNSAYAQLLVRNMLDIEETATPNWQQISLIHVIEDVLALLERKMPSKLYQIEWETDLTLDNIEADETQIKQVFMNLIRNALDAMPNGGILKFWVGREGEDAVVEVTDTGIGISPENLNQLFTLGFTTKPEGYGIGLYSIKTIISRHKGRIDAFSRLGHGTTFRITLPLTQKEVINES